MKKLVLFMLLYAAISSCKKDSVNDSSGLKNDALPEIKLNYLYDLKPIVFEYTSTGCPGCGSWGKPTFHSIVNEFNDKVVPIAVHIKYGDPMITATSETIAANRYGQNYTPQIWINDTNGVQLVNGLISPQASINFMRQLIANSHANLLCYIDGQIISEKGSQSELKIGIKSKSLNKSNEYFLACYLMQDSVSHQQSGYASNPALHNFIIRNDFNGTWGNKVDLKDDIFEEIIAFESEFIKSNHYYTLVLWEKSNNRFRPLGGLTIR